MAFVVNDRTGEGFVFKGILLLEVRRIGRHRVTANLYRGKDIPTKQETSAYITAAVIPDTYVLEQHRRVCMLNGSNPDINVEFTFDIMDSDTNRRLFIGLWSQQTGRQECHDFVGGFSFAIREILENDMGGWYYLLPRVVGLRSYVRVTHYALDVLTMEYEQKCWLLLKAGRGIKVSFEKDLLPATIKQGNRAALEAGLVEGDVILEMNRRDVSNCSGDVILDYMWEFIHTDIELLVARLIHVDYPEPYQRDHYRVIISTEPRYNCDSSPLQSDHGSPYDFALDESPFNMGRSMRLEHGEKTPGKGNGKSIGKRISGAMNKISKQLFGRRRIRSKSQERGRSKSQDRGRFYDSGEHAAGRSPHIPKRSSGRAYGSCRSISASRDSGLYTEEEDKENLNDHVYVNLDSLVSRPLQLGRRPQSMASVSALHNSEGVNPLVLRSSLRKRHAESIVPGSSSDGEQLKPMVTGSSRTSRRLNSTTLGSVLHGEEVKPTDCGSELRSRCLLKSAASVSALQNENVNTTALVSSMDDDIPRSFATSSAPSGKEVTSALDTNNKCLNSMVTSALNTNSKCLNSMVTSALDTNNKCLNSMVSSSALNSNSVKLTAAAGSTLNNQCLRHITSGSMLNIEKSNATDSNNTRVSIECQQSMTARPTLNGEQLKSTLASGSMLTDEPPMSTATCSTPNEHSLTSTASGSDLMRSPGTEGLGSFRLPSHSVKRNYFSSNFFTPSCASPPDSFTGTGLTGRMLNLDQTSLINLNQSSFGAQNATSAPRPRDQRDSIKLDEPSKPVDDENSTFDCTFVSDIIQEDGGEEPMSWLSSFTDSPFSRPVCNLDGGLEKTNRFSS